MNASKLTRRNSRSIRTLSSAPNRAATSSWPNGRPASWEISGEGVQDYVRSIIKADMEEKGDHDVFRKIRKDFDTAGVKIPDAEIRAVMVEFLTKAVNDIEDAAKKS